MLIKILIIIVTAVLMLTGLIGSLVPIIPGPLLILLGAFVYSWYTDFAIISWGCLAGLGALALLSQLLDYIATLLGAKRFGAGRWGIIGSVVGGIIGLFFGGFLGILFGPFLGAIAGELLSGREFNASLKIGFGTLIGFLAGTIGRIVIAMTMVGIFLIQIF